MNAKNTPRDVFLYLLAIITLVASAISFGSLAYKLIDIRWPDVLHNFVNYAGMRMSLATLVIVFPVFVWVSWYLRKDVVHNPEKKDLRIRRWLMYLTVFIASLVIIGDLVALIYNFLQGELTVTFIWKVVTILLIAGASLFYYLAELRDLHYRRKMFSWIVVVVVAVIIGLGFYKAGSPQNQRLLNFDQQKTSDLQMIQDRLVYYWQQKAALPTALGQLNDPISGFNVPNDPQSGQAYQYQATGPRSFELCANFNLPSGPDESAFFGGNWQHDSGQVCFNRTIDQALYPQASGAPKSAPMIPAR
ncbi:MAG TPA: DUF5671 domain-containing protein [Candidatus Paceibacterota bacterium]|nr:DUF5671 domain-containing protein [Candidatus Paceibacterota bacterium]